MIHLARHLDLLVALLSRDDERAAAAIRTSGDTLDAFGAFARRHQLSGYVHTLVGDAGLADQLPLALRTELETRHRAESRKRRVLDEAQADVTDAFRASAVDCVLLKGAQLADRFYGGIGQRASWDLDLLVRQEDLDASRDVLRDCGYVQHSPMLFGERVSVSVAHALDFVRGEVGLDLHWKLASHPSFRIDYGRLWERRESWTMAGRRYRVLAVEDELTLNLLASHKDIERGAFRLRSFVDLWMILATIDPALDWAGYFARREDEHVRKICAGVLALFLVVMQAGSRFANLTSALEGQDDLARVGTRDEALGMLAPTLFGPGRRVWASRLYHSPLQHLAWWAVTLPVRLNVHKPGKVKRLSRDVQRWLRPTR